MSKRPECDWPEGFDRRTAELMAQDRAERIRALPLPVSADGRDAVIEECARIAKGVEKKSRVISGFWQRDDKQFYQRGLRDAAKEIRLAIRTLKSTPHQGGEGK